MPKTAEGNKVPWEEIVRFFSGESLDTVPGSALPALKAVSLVQELSVQARLPEQPSLLIFLPA